MKRLIIIFCLINFFFKENDCLPLEEKKGEAESFTFKGKNFRGSLPTGEPKRNRRQEDGSSGGVGDFLTNVAQAFSSPTMFIGGFSMMMQPMPNGTQLAGHMMEMIPNFSGLISKLPGLPLPGAGQQKNVKKP